MNMHQKTAIFFLKKAVKTYFKAIILSIKIYENILKFNFLMGGAGGDIRHTDCLLFMQVF